MGNKSLLTTEMTQNYKIALSQFFSSQNTDGSWGRTRQERVTFTAQAIQLMSVLNMSYDDEAFQKAIRWLENNVKKGTNHWTTRLEVGLQIGQFERLLKDGYVEDFINDIENFIENPTAEYLNLFWDIIPTLIAMFPYEDKCEEMLEKKIPHEEIIERLKKHCEHFDNHTMTVQGQPNHTGLIALYFSTISKKEEYKQYKDDSKKMINWLKIRKSRSGQFVYWEESRGITSYVLIDIIRCDTDISTIKSDIAAAFRYLSPDEDGYVEEDKNTTFDTALHSTPEYVRMLVLRAYAEVERKLDSDRLKIFVSEARNLCASGSKKINNIIGLMQKNINLLNMDRPIIVILFLIIIVIIFFLFDREAGTKILDIILGLLNV